MCSSPSLSVHGQHNPLLSTLEDTASQITSKFQEHFSFIPFSIHLLTTIHNFHKITVMSSKTSHGGRGRSGGDSGRENERRGRHGRENKYRHDEYWWERQLYGSGSRGSSSRHSRSASPGERPERRQQPQYQYVQAPNRYQGPADQFQGYQHPAPAYQPYQTAQASSYQASQASPYQDPYQHQTYTGYQSNPVSPYAGAPLPSYGPGQSASPQVPQCRGSNQWINPDSNVPPRLTMQSQIKAAEERARKAEERAKEAEEEKKQLQEEKKKAEEEVRGLKAKHGAIKKPATEWKMNSAAVARKNQEEEHRQYKAKRAANMAAREAIWKEQEAATQREKEVAAQREAAAAQQSQQSQQLVHVASTQSHYQAVLFRNGKPVALL